MDSKVIKCISVFNLFTLLFLSVYYSPFSKIWGVNANLSIFESLNEELIAQKRILYISVLVVLVIGLIYGVIALSICFKDDPERSIGSFSSIFTWICLLFEILLYFSLNKVVNLNAVIVFLFITCFIKIYQIAALIITICLLKKLYI